MFLSTNRHVGFNLEAELDDARAEIQDLRAENAALKRDLEVTREIFCAVQRDMNAQRAHYEYVNQQVAQTNPYAIT